jgi:hypothetical protein
MPAKAKKKPPGKLIRRAPRKANDDEIAERRREVMRLRTQGLGYRAIATKLGVGHMTVKRDIEYIRAKVRERMSKFERNLAISESVSAYEQVEMEAWKQYALSKPGTTQAARFLDVVRAARGDQVKLLTDLGFLKKAPTEVKHDISTKVIQDWTPAAQDLVALAIIKAGLTAPQDPTPIIDVKALPPGGNGVSRSDSTEDQFDEGEASDVSS